MRVLTKIALMPIIIILTVLQMVGTAVTGLSSWIFHLIAALFLLTGIMSYLTGNTAGAEAVRLIITGVVVDLIPSAMMALVIVLAKLNIKIALL